MPVRPRRSRRPTNVLTMELDLALTIGGDRSPEAKAVFRKYPWRYGPDSWAVQYFEHGRDIRDDVPPVEIPPGYPMPKGISVQDLNGEPLSDADRAYLRQHGRAV